MLIPILYNIRSIHNVGSILRTCDGFGINQVVCTGYTPHPQKGLPHEQLRLMETLHKTALGAEKTVESVYALDIENAIKEYREQGFAVYALEQASNSQNLAKFSTSEEKAILILGEEVHGIPADILALCDQILEIPMRGQKESFNVSVAAGIALYELKRLSLLGN